MPYLLSIEVPWAIYIPVALDGTELTSRRQVLEKEWTVKLPSRVVKHLDGARARGCDDSSKVNHNDFVSFPATFVLRHVCIGAQQHRRVCLYVVHDLQMIKTLEDEIRVCLHSANVRLTQLFDRTDGTILSKTIV
jgi:hypothetical protein